MLKVYAEANSDTAFSINGAMTNPLVDMVHGREGNEFERKVYLRSDNSDYYSGVRVKAYSAAGDADINPTLSEATGWGIKLLADNGSAPTDAEWDAQPWATEYEGHATFDTFTGSSTYHPFWIKLVSPAGLSVGMKSSISLVLMYKETAEAPPGGEEQGGSGNEGGGSGNESVTVDILEFTPGASCGMAPAQPFVSALQGDNCMSFPKDTNDYEICWTQYFPTSFVTNPTNLRCYVSSSGTGTGILRSSIIIYKAASDTYVGPVEVDHSVVFDGSGVFHFDIDIIDSMDADSTFIVLALQRIHTNGSDTLSTDIDVLSVRSL